MKRSPSELRQSSIAAAALLNRAALIEAAALLGRPSTATEILCVNPALARRPADLTRLAQAASALGPDEQGRSLVPSGMTREAQQLWTALLPKALGPALQLGPVTALLALVARPGESCVQAADRLLAGALAGALEELRPKAPPPAPEPEPQLGGHDEIVTELELD